MSAVPERPSARAVERLATGVGEDVTDLRTQLHRALDEAERLQAAGRDDLAVSVLEEQRDVLLVVHQRLEARLADAAVEREAERVVDGAAPVLDVPPPAPAPTVAVGDESMALRLVASAVAAVLGVALLLSPEFGAGGLTAAGSSAASDAPQDTTSSRTGDGARDVGATAPATSPERVPGAAQHDTDLRALALPEADRLSTRALDDDDATDADPADIGELLPLTGVGAIDSLVPGTSPLPEDDPGEQGTDEPDSDGGTGADDGATTAEDDTADDGTTQDARGDDTASDEPAQDDGAPSSQDGATDDGGSDGGTSRDDGSTGGDQTDPDGSGGSSGADTEDPSGGGLDLSQTGGESPSLER